MAHYAMAVAMQNVPMLVVDASQSLGLVPLDVKALDADFLVAVYDFSRASTITASRGTAFSDAT